MRACIPRVWPRNSKPFGVEPVPPPSLPQLVHYFFYSLYNLSANKFRTQISRNLGYTNAPRTGV